jgi:Spy/CpxP family protein refolding chaperone
MSNKLHQLILGVGLLGLAAGAWAQGGPDAGPHGDGNGEYHHRHHHHHCHHHHHHHGHDGWRGDRGGDRGGEHGRDGMMGGGMEGGRGFMLARGLNLSDAQKQQIHTILENARQNAMKEMKDGKPGDAKAGGMPDRLALMNPGDPNYAAAVQSAKKRAADRIQHMSDLKQQLYNVLTAEQKSEVQKRIASWKTRMAQREEGSKGPPSPANR